MPINTAQLRPVVIDDLIRVGRANDGGYVLPKRVVAGCTHLVSYGINTDWSFERGVRRLNPGVVIHAYDHTLKGSLLLEHFAKSWAKAILCAVRLRFHEAFKNLIETARFIDYRIFFTGPNTHFRQRVWYGNVRNSITVRETIEKISRDKKILLKIDIEGSEYRIIDDILAIDQNVIGFIVEFHGIDIVDEKFNRIIGSIKKTFYIAHIHGNNYGDLTPVENFPDTIEIVFINRRLLENKPEPSTRPYPIEGLDQPNNPDEPDFPLVFAAS